MSDHEINLTETMEFSDLQPSKSKEQTINIAIVGGDLRQIYLANSLAEEGYTVTIYGNDCSYYDLPQFFVEQFIQQVIISNSLPDILTSNPIIIGPVPFSKDNTHINAPVKDNNLTIAHFLQNLTKRPIIISGSMKPSVTAFLDTHSIPYYDFMKSDAITIYNAIATAEGTIVEAIKRSTINLQDSNSLVIGFGRCGSILANKLHALNTNVTVAVRRPEVAANVYACGLQSISFSDLKRLASSYDFIFNTVPSMVLDKSILRVLNPNVTIIDIASNPGGTDFEYARKHNLNAVLCLGLPGIYAPKTSALIIKQYTLDILSKVNLNNDRNQ